MGKRYVVSAEYITAATADPITGKQVVLGFYRNALLPEDLSEETIEHHLSTQQITAVKIDDDGNLTEYEDERQTDPAEAKVTDGLGPPNTMPAAGDDVQEPKRSDDKDAWVKYAVSKGADADDIEDKNPTKADLIATWGTPK